MISYLAAPCFKSYFLYLKYYPQKKQLEIGFKTGNVYGYFKLHLRRGRIISKLRCKVSKENFFMLISGKDISLRELLNSFTMTYNDIIGTIGVGIILFAYFLNTMKYIPVNGKLYYVLNSIGGALSCYAAMLIDFWPFVILEAVWTFVSIYGLIKTMKVAMT